MLDLIQIKVSSEEETELVKLLETKDIIQAIWAPYEQAHTECCLAVEYTRRRRRAAGVFDSPRNPWYYCKARDAMCLLTHAWPDEEIISSRYDCSVYGRLIELMLHSKALEHLDLWCINQLVKQEEESIRAVLLDRDKMYYPKRCGLQKQEYVSSISGGDVERKEIGTMTTCAVLGMQRCILLFPETEVNRGASCPTLHAVALVLEYHRIRDARK